MLRGKEGSKHDNERMPNVDDISILGIKGEMSPG
jgi:hypothetical protein